MSRVGKQPIALPEKVKAAVSGSRVTVEGPLGKLEHTVGQGIQCSLDETGRILKLTRVSDAKPHRMQHGLDRALVRNMVVGVTAGYKKELEVVGIGYSCKLEGNTLVLEVGFSNAIKVAVPKGIKVEVTQPTNPGRMVISGIDKHDVGQFAANVRTARPPEPYQGKGIKYIDEVVRRKAGKAFVGAGG